MRDEAPAYVAQCFRWAHEADPQALLFYNEAEADGVNKKSDAVYGLIRDFKREGVPIDGVGLQMHIEKPPDVASISANIARFTALGVQVHITEMDVLLPVDANGNATPADLQRQADIYRQIAEACLSHPGCTAIQTWGFTDKYSWISSHSKNTRGGLALRPQLPGQARIRSPARRSRLRGIEAVTDRRPLVIRRHPSRLYSAPAQTTFNQCANYFLHSYATAASYI